MVGPYTPNNNSEEELLPPNNYNSKFFRDMDSLEFLFKQPDRGDFIQSRIRIQTNTISADEYEVVLDDCPNHSQPLLKTKSKTAAGVFYYINTILDDQRGKSPNQKLGKLESNFAKKKVCDILNKKYFFILLFTIIYFCLFIEFCLVY